MGVQKMHRGGICPVICEAHAAGLQILDAEGWCPEESRPAVGDERGAVVLARAFEVLEPGMVHEGVAHRREQALERRHVAQLRRPQRGVDVPVAGDDHGIRRRHQLCGPSTGGRGGAVGVPTGVIQFAHDIGIRRYAEPSHTITRWTEITDFGGHFAAMEEPDLLVDDVRAFFRDLR